MPCELVVISPDLALSPLDLTLIPPDLTLSSPCELILISPDLARRFVEFYGKWMDEGAREQARRHGQQPQGYTMAN
jgi:hypothetical protein